MFADQDLICYKETQIDSHGKLKFFLEKHSTKEGSWGCLNIQEGEIDFVFLDGDGQELSHHRINKHHPQLSIPPSSWHKISTVSESFRATLSFSCKRHRYFSKKYGLGSVHSDLLYVYENYFNNLKNLEVLDVGCGSGRNLLFLALEGHSMTGLDYNRTAIQNILEISQKEAMNNIKAEVQDLNEPLNLKEESYDLVLSTVTLQFLNRNRINSLLLKLQRATRLAGFNFLVFPIRSEQFSLPASFSYLAEIDELYHFYQDRGWSILEYKESVGQLHKKDEFGKPIQGLFGLLLAQKTHKSFPL